MYAIWRRSITSSVFMCRYLRQELYSKPLCNQFYNDANITSTLVNCPATIQYNSVRFKSKKKTDSDDEEEDFHDDASLSRDSKVMKFKTTSMRTDNILKTVLGVARNKIEQVFYESKIRVNGKKILKKSASVRLGDEIDVIKSVSPKNPDHLYVARVEILNVTASAEEITVTARRFKNLLIENYETDPFKGNPTSEI